MKWYEYAVALNMKSTQSPGTVGRVTKRYASEDLGVYSLLVEIKMWYCNKPHGVFYFSSLTVWA